MSREFEWKIVQHSGTTTTSEQEFKRASHRLITPQCPSIPRLEKVARGRGTLAEMVHKNRCAYCQRSIAINRELLKITPWPERLFAAARQAVNKLKETARELLPAEENAVFAAGQTNQGARAEFRSAKAVILRPDLTSQPAKVELRKLDFVERRDLWMTLRLHEPVTDFSDDHRFELLLMSDAQVFGPFTLPALGAGHEEEIMLQLPLSLAEGWEQQLKFSPNLPFEFVFSLR